jgi:hypothetical protein
MLNGRRAGALAMAVVVGACFAAGASPVLAKPTPAEKCEAAIGKAESKFLAAKLKGAQKCANKAVKKGTDLDSCVNDSGNVAKGLAKKVAKFCSADLLDDLGVSQACNTASLACTSITVSDAASLQLCIECRLRHAANCVVATTYGLTNLEAADGCFASPSAAFIDASIDVFE